ncbi:PilZ domain-containing protein [Shewanella insulae]|uniref:PilZ domain-containing protein n=1 Tax=Shewanella insulae TaxID=2681496 RepID=A0A6L7I1F4_9GAMM|nr:PilZ domain-containing protein [Shewanella insulae]MCG9713635.1 PilZ domain-containing protein [Shewanella insulae]MCG9737018.1 PilZ domain-containing protein [Shewanella insulae]MCG9755841.1 PilZ domain-containing protein [Shewanella insulae]MXR70375.1 PilZ domain-containing protein [Shewanella insulae]
MDQNHEDFEERRQSLRIDMEAERILISWTDGLGVVHTDDGICMDLARRGVLIEYKKPFALGELLTVTFNPNTETQNSVKAQVCRCTECTPQRFHVAMQII